MKYETEIGLRYLRSKRKERFISFTTWIAAAGIAIGVMALIIVIAVMTGFQDKIKERILGISPHILVLSVGADMPRPREVVDAVRKIKGVTEVYPFITFQAMAQAGRQVSGILVKGFNPEDVGSMGRLLKEGSIDALNRKGTILIGKELSKHLGLLVGSSFTLMVPFGGYSPMGSMPETVKVTVGGILETGMYEIDSTMIIMSLKEVETIMGIGPTGVEVKLVDVYQANEVRREIMKSLGPGYFGRTWIEMNRNLFSALKLEKIVMFIILALIILVASFNIISSLIMTVMEKKKDIAILKAIGAKKRSIMKIFMIEGLTIGIVGALVGSFIGYLGCEIVDRFELIKLPPDIYYITTLPMKVSLFDVVVIALVTVAICVISTLYPSYKAANIDPVETLRYE